MSHLGGAMMVAVRASGVMIFDGSSRNLATRLRDDDNLQEETAISKRVGFDGKCVIHRFN